MARSSLSFCTRAPVESGNSSAFSCGLWTLQKRSRLPLQHSRWSCSNPPIYHSHLIHPMNTRCLCLVQTNFSRFWPRYKWAIFFVHYFHASEPWGALVHWLMDLHIDEWNFGGLSVSKCYEWSPFWNQILFLGVNMCMSGYNYIWNWRIWWSLVCI